jgi:DSF synthase
VEEMILSGKIYTAEEMKDMGVIDMVVDKGEGVQAVNDLIDSQKKRNTIYKTLYKVRHVVNPISLKELMSIGELWVDAAMQLTNRDLRMMQRLLRAQQKRLTASLA